MELLERLNIIPSKGLHVVALTGAGVSAESGVPISKSSRDVRGDSLRIRLIMPFIIPKINLTTEHHERSAFGILLSSEFDDLNAITSPHRIRALPV